MKKIILALSLMTSTINMFGQDSQTITPDSELKYVEAPDTYFTGKARFAPLLQIPNSEESYAIVHFEAGTINNWHTHSHGQYLIVTEGEGRTQEWGKPIQIIKKGDVVWCPPNVKHWHGAGEHTAMSHIVVSPKAKENKVTWLERVDLPQTTNKIVKITQNEPLTERQLSIAPIASLTAMGDVERLKPALAEGLAKGLTVSEIKEIFTHIQAYVGFPRALNGLIAFNNLLKERSEQGIHDSEGIEPTAISSVDYYRLGEQTLKAMGSGTVASSEPLFGSQGMDYALKANLFGYLFSRDNLSYVDREIVVVSALSVLEGVESQLGSHLQLIKNLGITKPELKKLIDSLKTINPKQAKNAQKVLDKI